MVYLGAEKINLKGHEPTRPLRDPVTGKMGVKNGKTCTGRLNANCRKNVKQSSNLSEDGPTQDEIVERDAIGNISELVLRRRARYIIESNV